MAYLIMQNKGGCCENGIEKSWNRVYEEITKKNSVQFELNLLDVAFAENDELGWVVDLGLCMWIHANKKFYLTVKCLDDRVQEIGNKFTNFFRFFIERKTLHIKINTLYRNTDKIGLDVPDAYFPLLIFNYDIYNNFFVKRISENTELEEIFCGNNRKFSKHEKEESYFFIEMAMKVCRKMLYRGTKDITPRMQQNLREYFHAHFENQNIMTVLLACIIYRRVRPENLRITQKEKVNNLLSEILMTAFHYTLGIQEVCENILKHTKQKRGVIYIRILSSNRTKSQFLNNVEQTEGELKSTEIFNDVEKWLELTVVDAGEKGILETQDINSSLEKTFDWSYDSNSNFTDAETEKEIEDLIYHKGLKVFNEHIKSANGLFYVQTMNRGQVVSYARQAGEPIIGENIKEAIGTQYKIWLPMHKVENLLWTKDIADGYRAYQDDHTQRMLIKAGQLYEHNCREIKIEINHGSNQKVVLLKCKELSKFIYEDTKSFYYFDFENVDSSGGKIIYFLALLAAKAQIKYMILYNVNNQLFEQFVKNYQKSVQAHWKNKSAYKNYFYVFNKEGTPIFVTNNFEEKKSLELRKYLWTYRGIYYNWREDKDIIPNIDREEQNEVLLPVELLGEYGGKKFSAPIFEKHMRLLFKNEMSDNNKFGLLYTGHVNLGDKVHVRKYYQGELLFDNNYYLGALAYILSKKLRSCGKKYYLVGYKKYSSVLLERVKELLGECIVGSYVYSKKNDEKLLFPLDDDFEIAIIVPIVSTLRTFEKVERFLRKNSRKDYKYAYFTFFVSRDGKIEDDVTNLEHQFNWKRITNEYIELKVENSLKNTEEIIRVYYFMMLHGGWQNALECKMCDISNLEESPEALIETGEDSLNLSVKLGIPYNNNPERMECFTKKLAESELKDFYKKMSRFIIEGHFNRVGSHFKHYLFCGKFFDEELKNNNYFNSWIERLKEEYSKSIGAVNILLVPNHKTNDSFCHFINEKVFNENTIIINEDFNNAFYSDFNKKYSYLKKLNRIRYIFLDSSMNTGNTWKKVYSLVSELGGEKDFSIISLVNRLDYSNKINVSMSGAKCYFFTEIYIPSIKEQKGDCWLCEEEIHLKNLCEDSLSANMRRFYQKKKKKVKLRELLEEDDNLFYKYRDDKKNTEINFLVTNEIYRQLFKKYDILQEGNNVDFSEYFGVDDKFRVKQNIVGGKVDYQYKIAFIKTMSRPFMNNFVGLRRFCVKVCVAELGELLKSPCQNDQEDQINYMSILLKRFGTLGCRFILNSCVSERIFEFYRKRKQENDKSKFLLQYAVAAKQLMLESEVNTLKFIQGFQQILPSILDNEHKQGDKIEFLKKVFYSHDIIIENAVKNYGVSTSEEQMNSNMYAYYYQEMQCFGVEPDKMGNLLQGANLILDCLDRKENENLGENKLFETAIGLPCNVNVYIYEGRREGEEENQIVIRGRRLNCSGDKGSKEEEHEEKDIYTYLHNSIHQNKKAIGGTFTISEDYIRVIDQEVFFHYSIGVSSKITQGLIFVCESEAFNSKKLLALYRILAGIVQEIIPKIFNVFQVDMEPTVEEIKDPKKIDNMRGKESVPDN